MNVLQERNGHAVQPLLLQNQNALLAWQGRDNVFRHKLAVPVIPARPLPARPWMTTALVRAAPRKEASTSSRQVSRPIRWSVSASRGFWGTRIGTGGERDASGSPSRRASS